ncbi:DUF3440 domain-containing protein [Aliivibrio sifiae]|uniref:Phosphoadenosine phosphosulfate reductase n=1 Tax=Aliivibrio sifiae TaxID=566293 RepID=A0A2S7X1A7_9GAMM|nr:DUF3440 domain-containing protein [Aliivibrio sifiae]PQJ83604.1 phosphoadenosine phosphosulfate reductase [Aliivibrio sifiae]GLR76754.1 phosphoadenosine phosphosulfate reductase [Aliivibrio sifiae]
MSKIPLNQNVYAAAKQRINNILNDFPYFYVSLSGGKDSGVLLNLVIEEAKKQSKLPIDVLIIDMEAQFNHTISYIQDCVEREEVNAYWICLPLSLRNASSQLQPKWTCWDRNVSHWVRPLPSHPSVISDHAYFDFYNYAMEFEDFVAGFNQWYQEKKGGLCAAFVGIRADESLNRYKTIKNVKKSHFKDYFWTTKECDCVYKAYPIYDWKTEDIWTANGRFNWSYNKIYDLMYLAGVPLSQQRLCQPYGDDQKKGLWLFHVLEPKTWEKIVSRVEGCQFGARYSKKQGHIIGYYKFNLPPEHTYRSYSKFLLNSMPNSLSKHYKSKIIKFILWWRKQGYHHIPDFDDKKLESQRKVPSWRRICKVLIKNDYWCRGLSFSQNKRHMKTKDKKKV